MIIKNVLLKQALLLTAVIALVNTGCKKDDTINEIVAPTVYDTIPAPPLAGNRILEYKIVNTQDLIYSAINDSAKTITVYLPYYFAVTFIEPEIRLPEGATITPASGELVNVFDKTSTTYSVTGKDGVKATYKLNVIMQQPDIVLNELSSATTTKSYKRGQVIGLLGQNFIPSPDISKVYLVGSDGTEILCTPETTIGNSVIVLWIIVPATVPAGSYKMKVTVYKSSKTMVYPITIAAS